jgi:hypothetical protein
MPRVLSKAWLSPRWAWFYVALAVVMVSACTVRLVSPYDEVIDKGVTQFQEEFFAFVAAMNRKAGTPAGTYAENVDFYDTWLAKLEALTERAIAADPTGTCPASETFGGIMAQGLGRYADALGREAPQNDDSLAGDCTARLLRYLERQVADFGAFHQAQADIGIPVSATAPVELVKIVVRAVLYTELAKRREG